MKKNQTFWRWLLVGVWLVSLFGSGVQSAKAATTLAAGDLAIIGFNMDDADEFAFVLLVDVTSGTVVNFTDNGWLAAGGFRTGEGAIVWTASTDYTAGTVKVYTTTGGEFAAGSSGVVLFSATGDQIIAYQGSDASPTPIYAVNDDGAGVWQADATSSNTSALPTGLINGTTAVALNEIDNAIYAGVTSGTQAELLAAISNKNNWTGSDTTRQTMPSGPFTVVPPVDTAPSVNSTTPASGATGVAMNANISVTFSENVNVAGAWYQILCASSGTHAATVSGGPLTFTINPTVDFTLGESCTVTIYASQVTDQDTNDPPDNMAANYSWSFTVAAVDNPPTVTSTVPTNGATGVADNTTVTINFSEDVTTSGTWYTFVCNSTPVTASVTGTGSQRVITPASTLPFSASCTVTVLAAQVTDLDGTPNPMASNYVLTFTVTDGACGPAATLISAIQGSTATSPMNGTSRTVEGIVVGDYQSTGQIGGFFVQEQDSQQDGNAATSEGIFVSSTTAVAVGNRVSATGTVQENDPITGGGTRTQLGGTVSVVVCGSGYSVTPATVNLPVAAAVGGVDYLERYEGMLVAFPDDLVVADNYYLGRFGMVSVTAADWPYAIGGRAYQFMHNHTAISTSPSYADFMASLALATVIIDDAQLGQNPDPIILPGTGLTAANTLRAGYRISGLTGVLDYNEDSTGVTWDVEAYRVQPVGQSNFTNTDNPRPTTSPATNGTLKVVSANTLNFFVTLGAGYNCGPDGTLQCRGATNTTEYNRQLNKLVAAFCTLNADIYGLMELENGTGDAAISALVTAMNNNTTLACASRTYNYIATGPIGTDAIRQGIIYDPATVTSVRSYAVLDIDAFVDPLNTGTPKNRPALAQSFEENVSGEIFTVVVNHLKSKGSTCGAGDDDPIQGNCNGTREAAADYLVNTWLPTNPTGLSPADLDYLIIGDLNAYAMEDPIVTIQNAGYVNLARYFGGLEAYSYYFDGLAGNLDYALASSTLAGQATGAADWHSNADEPDVLDYNTEYKTAGQIASLYAPDPYRASDHDPVVVGLFMPYGLVDTSDLPTGYATSYHQQPAGGRTIWLGATVDNDITFADASDNASDDGVVRFPGLRWKQGVDGGKVTLTVTGTIATGYVTAWIDWTRDGDFNDADEQIFTNEAVTVGTPKDKSFFIPISADIANGTARSYQALFRVYPTPQTLEAPDAAPSPAGAVSDGEGESYTWGFSPTAVTLERFGATVTPGGLLSVVAVTGLLAALLGGLGLLKRRH